jgi:general secretion pathway protein D
MSKLQSFDRMQTPRQRVLLLASFVALCVLVGSLSYAVNEPQRREVGRQPSKSTVKLSSSLNQAQALFAKTDAVGTSYHLSDLPKPNSVAKPTIAEKRLELIEFEDVELSEAMRLFAEQSGLNVITSTDAGKTKITVYLKNVTPIDALEAMVKANGLFYRIEANSGIVRIATLKEYEKDLSSFREEQTRVFTLLYPNPSSVAQVIQQVFGDRVQFNRADAEVEDLVDLSRRFNRFDLVDGRSLGLGNSSNRSNNQFNQSGNPFGSGLGNGSNLAGFSAAGINGNFTNPNAQPRNLSSGLANRKLEALNNLSADEIQQLENQIAKEGRLTDEVQAELMQRKEATIYVSTIRRNNQVIVRTGDARSMEQIAALVAQLDVPTPTVLLEVKVLRVILADGFNSAFEYFAGGDKSAGAISDGSLTPNFPGGNQIARSLGDGLGVTGGVPGALTFQMVDKNFRVRMQLLQSKNCVTALATPLILTANNEVSRIFVGDTLPFTVGFTPSQVLSSVNAVNGAVAATPVTELRDVGQSLLITPNINADRTVTLRVVEENSERVVGGSSIPVPATSGAGVTNISVDTVRRRTISGTVVAQDGMAVALGGMIEEHVSDARDQIPVLGNIPGLGLLFRRQSSSKARSELVVIVRPYVFNTPSESAATSEFLLGELSTHPNSPTATGTMNLKLPCPVTRSDAECSQRAKLFQFHSGAPASL